MPHENLSCSEAQSALAEIKSLKGEFERVLEDATRTGEREQARMLRFGLEARMRELRDSLISPVERKLDLKGQYESQRNILGRSGILEHLSSGALGVHGIDGKAYPIPSYQEMKGLVREKKDVLEKKADQGFTKMLIIPFGMKLDDLVEKYKALILKHELEGKLFATKENDSDPDEPLALDKSQPVWVWGKYQDADVNGTLVYDPKEFSRNHGGKTKMEMLGATQDRPSPAWRFVMIETDLNIPRSGKGNSVGGRMRLEANRTPKEYLQAIGRGEYQNESGTIPEEWIMQAITALEEKNQVIDDYRGKGSIAYNTGAYFPASGSVPYAYWTRDNRQAFLYGDVPTSRDGDIGARSAVRVYD